MLSQKWRRHASDVLDAKRRSTNSSREERLPSRMSATNATNDFPSKWCTIYACSVTNNTLKCKKLPRMYQKERRHRQSSCALMKILLISLSLVIELRLSVSTELKELESRQVWEHWRTSIELILMLLAMSRQTRKDMMWTPKRMTGKTSRWETKMKINKMKRRIMMEMMMIWVNWVERMQALLRSKSLNSKRLQLDLTYTMFWSTPLPLVFGSVMMLKKESSASCSVDAVNSLRELVLEDSEVKSTFFFVAILQRLNLSYSNMSIKSLQEESIPLVRDHLQLV